MSRDIQASIIEHLRQVDVERRRREAAPVLKGAVQAVKAYQQRRFRLTYADLLATARYGAASRFFLEELYGPIDFSQRDAQFARVVPALVRLFPAEVVRTVDTMARLHAVSEQLDSEMGAHLTGFEAEASAYIHAWQATGRADAREAQIALTLEVGAALARYTRKPLMYQTLRLMRGAARAANLGNLQRFLESGFDAFRAMNGADEFLSVIACRERHLANTLFTGDSKRDNHPELPRNITDPTVR